MPLSGDELKDAIARSVDGLLFPSESDAPVTPILLADDGKGAIKAADVRRLKSYPEDTSIRSVSVTRFFEPATKTEDWFGPEERERADRFGDLLALLRANLKGLRVWKAEAAPSTWDAYAIGRTTAGEIAGVVTQVVET